MFFVSQGSRSAGTKYRQTPTVKLIPTPKPLAPSNRAISQGTEFAGGIIVFFLIGLGLDAWLGTTPFFMVGLVLFSTVGQFIKIWFSYSQEMDRLQAERGAAARDAHRLTDRG